MTVKETYKTLIRPIVQHPTGHKCIKRVLQKDWAKIYLLFKKKKKFESRMRISQYKILNNILHFSNGLHKFDYAEFPLCSFCNSETETTTHLFCQCRETIQLWISLSNWCKDCLTLPTLEPSTASNSGFRDIKDEKANLLTISLYYLKCK